MPHNPNDNLYPHLPLIIANAPEDRRRRPAPPTPPPNRGGRQRFADDLTGQVDEVTAQAAAADQVAGIRPHLVFRMPFAKGAVVEEIGTRLNEVGLRVVSIEPDRAIIAFKSDTDLGEFRQAIAAYRRGPRINPKTNRPFASTKWDVLEYLEPDEMRNIERDDRIGPRIREQITAQQIQAERIYKLDVEVWHPGDRDSVEALITDVQQLLDFNRVEGERILDRFIGDELCLLRVGIVGRKLNDLLDLSAVAEVELPPHATFSPAVAIQRTRDDYPAPPRPDEDAPRVCILDSGISANHPLLRSNVGHSEAVLTTGQDAGDQHGHGTMVAGLAVFGDVRSCYESGLFESPILLFSARVLNDALGFDDDRLIVTQLRAAVEVFKGPPHNCRVFNLSLGSRGSAFETGVERQPAWAESLDLLARELKVLFVVCSGNNMDAQARNAGDAEQVLRNYPDLLFEPAARIADPGTAAIAVTVGSLAQSDLVAQRRGLGQDDIARAVAGADCPSPFTRTGPGVSRGIKPEFVDYGGNLSFQGHGAHRVVEAEPATSTMSFSREPVRNLFSYDIGTSFAAPRVSRKAALLWHVLGNVLRHDPDPNLVRALMGASASVPGNATALFAATQNPEERIIRSCGYGLVDLDFALDSSDRRVCLVAEGVLELDKFTVYSVPIPPEFCAAPGRKRITVGLAYDPPVRRRRADYLGVEMSFRLVRGKTIDEVVAAYRQLGPDDEPERAIAGKFLLSLEPPETPRNVPFARKKSTLQVASFSFIRPQDYGDTYYLVIRAERKWAPTIIETQAYGVAVSLEADEPHLYNLVQERVRAAVRLRTRR